jgi:expansin (peptidoglycan-binding protein)
VKAWDGRLEVQWKVMEGLIQGEMRFRKEEGVMLQERNLDGAGS